MVVPDAARSVAAVVGGVLVLAVWASIIGTVIVPRPVRNWLTRWADRAVGKIYYIATSRIDEYRRRDRVLATRAATTLIAQLFTWLGLSLVGFALLLWPFAGDGGIAQAFKVAGSSMFTLGFAVSPGALPLAIVFVDAFTGLVIITLQIAYLPALYGAFNRRETEVALLNARAGVPSWGPELLSRTYYALGSGTDTLDTLPDLYAAWERWAADVAESHTTYLPLVNFRSPRPLSSWVTALLAVLDSAAMFLSLSPGAAPVVPARLCLRSGFICFTQIARAMGFDVPDEPDPNGQTELSYEEFLDAVARLRKVGFPIERADDLAAAWTDFVGWRLNYEQAAYEVAAALDVVPAMWSGPRRHPGPAVPPIRPALGRPPRGPAKKAAQAAKAAVSPPTSLD
jgi:hypothetical protein